MMSWNRGGRWLGIAAGALAVILVLAALDRGRAASAPPPGESEGDWKERFPREYDSWRQAREPAWTDIGYGPGRTKWGGRKDRGRMPQGLFAGLAFAAPGAMSPTPPRHPVACGICHDPQTLERRLTQPAYREALATRGETAPNVQVCAQCHSAQVQDWRGGRTLVPGTAEALLSLAEQPAPAEWDHAVSITPMLKVRHPEYELWSQGSHAHKGVTCVDCHMPFVREGQVRITSHRLKSPLLDLNASCVPCHRWGETRLLAQVEAIQDATMALQERASAALLTAHGAVGEARRAKVPEAQLAPARALIRLAQTRWDLVASEGSTGFHAPQAAAALLGTALDEARQAELLARRLSAGR